jgi:hypothetical protein
MYEWRAEFLWAIMLTVSTVLCEGEAVEQIHSTLHDATGVLFEELPGDESYRGHHLAH